MNRVDKIVLIFVGVTAILGGLLTMFIFKQMTGEYDFSIWIPVVLGTGIGYIIFYAVSKRKKRNNGNIPAIDERSLLLMQRYFLWVLYIVLFGGGAVLLILCGVGVDYIETGMLAVVLMLLFIVIGLGALVVKRL